MKLQAYFCESDDGGCVTYPVVITDENPAASYGIPVVIIDGEPYGPGDMPLGQLQIPEAVYAEVAERLVEVGYEVCPAPVDAWWLERWKRGEPVEDHWHPEARNVLF